jgi:hypothetical protein
MILSLVHSDGGLGAALVARVVVKTAVVVSAIKDIKKMINQFLYLIPFSLRAKEQYPLDLNTCPAWGWLALRIA